jgi:phosphoribosyl-ATP pyrophosphohydrolase/phosphoribosyl-AMP cyclohydrolase
LIKATPSGPVCHTGSPTCFGENESGPQFPTDFLLELETVIDDRRSRRTAGSYVTTLFERGINKIAQKVGEEAVELVIEAKDDDTDKFRSEAADLLFHFLVLLRAKDTSISDVTEVLRLRRR